MLITQTGGEMLRNMSGSRETIRMEFTPDSTVTELLHNTCNKMFIYSIKVSTGLASAFK